MLSKLEKFLNFSLEVYASEFKAIKLSCDMVDNPHYYFCFLMEILLGNKLLHSNFYIEM